MANSNTIQQEAAHPAASMAMYDQGQGEGLNALVNKYLNNAQGYIFQGCRRQLHLGKSTPRVLFSTLAYTRALSASRACPRW